MAIDPGQTTGKMPGAVVKDPVFGLTLSDFNRPAATGAEHGIYGGGSAPLSQPI